MAKAIDHAQAFGTDPPPPKDLAFFEVHLISFDVVLCGIYFVACILSTQMMMRIIWSLFSKHLTMWDILSYIYAKRKILWHENTIKCMKYLEKKSRNIMAWNKAGWQCRTWTTSATLHLRRWQALYLLHRGPDHGERVDGWHWMALMFIYVWHCKCYKILQDTNSINLIQFDTVWTNLGVLLWCIYLLTLSYICLTFVYLSRRSHR